MILKSELVEILLPFIDKVPIYIYNIDSNIGAISSLSENHSRLTRLTVIDFRWQRTRLITDSTEREIFNGIGVTNFLVSLKISLAHPVLSLDFIRIQVLFAYLKSATLLKCVRVCH